MAKFSSVSSFGLNAANAYLACASVNSDSRTEQINTVDVFEDIIKIHFFKESSSVSSLWLAKIPILFLSLSMWSSLFRIS